MPSRTRGGVARQDRPVLALRVALLIALAAAALLALRATRRPSPAGSFTCPMHRTVIVAAAGDCPICAMPLEPVAPTRPRTDHQPAGGAAPPDELLLAPGAGDIPRHDTSPVERRRITRRLRSAAWIDGRGAIATRLHRDDAAALKPGFPARFVPSDPSHPEFELRVAQIAAVVSDSSVSALRLVRAAAGAPVAPTEVGWVDFGERAIDALVVPSAAILESADGPFVLVAAPEGRRFTRRPIEIHEVAGGAAFIRAGLGEHDRVVTMSAFSLDAARRLQADAR